MDDVQITKQQITATLERRVLSCMIMHDEFLRQINGIYQEGLFETEYGNTIAQWCLEHFNAYQEAPKKAIKEIYAEKVSFEVLGKEQAESLFLFLERLSRSFDPEEVVNHNALLDRAILAFRKKAIEMAGEKAAALANAGKIAEAEMVYKQLQIPSRPSEVGLDVFGDLEANYASMDTASDTLWTLTGDAGKMFGSFMRGDFWCIEAPEKRGKSRVLVDWALKSARRGFNVALFQCGDLPESVITRRLNVAATGLLYAKPRNFHLTPVLDCQHNQYNECGLDKRRCDIGCREKDGTQLTYEDAVKKGYEPCTVCHKNRSHDFTPATFWEHRDYEVFDRDRHMKLLKRITESQRLPNKLKMVYKPAHEQTVAGIEAQLTLWAETFNWNADFVFIDYADILGPEPFAGTKEYRHQVNYQWIMARAAAVRHRCCWVWATQSDKLGHMQKSLSLANTAEDKRKLSHVTHMVGLNQESHEKRQGIMRMSALILRESEFYSDDEIIVHQDIGRGQAMIRSFFVPPDDRMTEENEKKKGNQGKNKDQKKKW